MAEKNGLIIKLPNKLSLDSNTLTKKFNSLEIDLPANYVGYSKNNQDGNGNMFVFSEPSRMILDGDGYIFFGYKGEQNLGKDIPIDAKNWQKYYNAPKSINTTEHIVLDVHSNGTTPLRWHILNADKIVEMKLNTIGHNNITLKDIATKCTNIKSIKISTYFGYLHLGDISALSNLTSLNRLILFNNIGISGDISALSNLTSLTELDLRYNTTISGDISALLPMSDITYLDISCINVSGDISLLDGMSKLKKLTICSSTIGKIIYTDEQIKALQDRGVTVTIITKILT